MRLTLKGGIDILPVRRQQPEKEDTMKKYVCKICGWVHEGEELPDDIVCPLCKHGAADFEKIQ